MSQEYLHPRASSSYAREGSSEQSGADSSQQNGPGYMIVGSGSEVSKNGTSLIASLQPDSGYGGSIAGDSAGGSSGSHVWHEGFLEEKPTPPHTPVFLGQFNAAAEHERQILSNNVHQAIYNSNRTRLGRSVTRTIQLLKELQGINRQWPASYPPMLLVHSSSSPNRPGIPHSQSFIGDDRDIAESPSYRPVLGRRAATSINDDSIFPSPTIPSTPTPAPRLVTPKIAREFSVLKLDLKLGALSQAELVHSLEKNSVASLLDGKISQSIKHLLSLRDRIDDTSSKVLVTGDLNAGKSTFCNALLRRKVLPEDQQPCTSIFCEVLDARENGGIEEVHAIHKDKQYDRNDESTYDVYPLPELETIVVDNSKYMQCKVYVKDIRSIDESLLNNGVVDIALIDAPGLNSDSVKTTAIFARQEEIDVVVFVVNAANHFTLSAQDFISTAAHEKAYMFIVVNGFDNIRDRLRCRRMILDQVASLSPHTRKEAGELVHFVSSNAIPVAPSASVYGNGNGGGGDGDGGDGPSSDDDVASGKRKATDRPTVDKGKSPEKIRDFENLEGALRRFVLEKRSRSKLAPARTYLLNLLSDLNILASVNRDVASSELERVTKELDELIPAYESSKKRRTEVSEELSTSVEESCDDVYNNTRSTLSTAISRIAEVHLGIEYPGLLAAFQYAADIKAAMETEIANTVVSCEEYARTKSAQAVNMIKCLGLLHVGEVKFPALDFHSEVMFRKRRHTSARQIDVQIDLWDFFDISSLTSLWERQEKLAGTGMAVTVIGMLGSRALGGVSWIDNAFGAVKIIGPANARRMVIPSLIATAILTAVYMLSQVPKSLPLRLSRKISAKLDELDYTHSNATRISSEVRKVLRMPALTLQNALQTNTDDLGRRKDSVGKIKHESEFANKYFANLFRESTRARREIEQIDLEGPLTGAMAEYQPEA